MDLAILSLALAAAAFAVSLAGGVAASLSGPVSAPTDRSAHELPTPAGGGVGVMLAAGAALAGLALARPETGLAPDAVARLGRVLAFAGGFGLLGALDDVFDLGARAKLAVVSAASVGLAYVAGPAEMLPLAPGLAAPTVGVVGLLGSALWVFTAVNTVNFMDGANGLVAGAMAAAFAGLSVASGIAGAGGAALLAAAAAGAAAGFLPFNARYRARAFLGDAGALFLGALFAGTALVLVQGARPAAVWIGPLLILPLLADVLLTLAWRARRGRGLMRPHREHAYHRRIAAGDSHNLVARAIWARMAAAAALAVGVTYAWRLAPDQARLATVAALAAATAACALLWVNDLRRAAQKARETTKSATSASASRNGPGANG